MLEAGTKLQERYRVERQVGQGGMGSVYLATDERFHNTVAIKEALFADENYRRSFAREARLLNSLKHSALPKVTDHFVEDKGQYIVMEYIGGDDLFEMMRKSGRPFPVEDVLEWADQLLDALAYLHGQGIIHRDIKPQNLKLTPQHKIILLDFGLAKGNPTDANYQTAAQSIFGYSRNYASLEQIQGTGTDPRSDIYSLAATLYHLVTDRVPADALTRVMMVLNENKDPLEPAGNYNPLLSQEVSDALGHCLALKASARPQNVAEVKEEIFPGTSSPFTAAAGTAAYADKEDLLTMNTKLIDAGADNAGTGRRSELQTEVMAEPRPSDSVATQVAGNQTEEYPGGASTKRGGFAGRLGLATAAGLIALIIGSVVAMVYLWPTAGGGAPPEQTDQMADTNSLDGLDSNLQNAEQPVQTVSESTPDMYPGETNSGRAEAADEKTTSTAPATVRTPTKAARNGKTQSSDKTGLVTDGVRITGDKVETDSVTITDKGVIVRRTPGPAQTPPPPKPPLTREQFEKLTPRQKRRLAEAIERERRLRNSRTRPPQPSVTPPEF